MRSLVVVRGGDKSLHMQWWCPKKNRSYDLALSYFGDNVEFWKDKCDFFHHFKGSKWEGLNDFIKKNIELVDKYDFIWFPDDDIWMHQKDLELFFTICKENDFIISQPSLMKGSFYSWDITCQKEYIYRNTNFVEVMAPCFKVATFHHFYPSFQENTSGWGLEWLWWKIAENLGINNFAIIDQVAMLHTREVGTAGTGGAKRTPNEEMTELFEKYNLQPTSPQVLGYVENYTQPKAFLKRLYKRFINIKHTNILPKYDSSRYL